MAKDKIDVSMILEGLGESILRRSWEDVKVNRLNASSHELARLDAIFEANMKDLSRFPNVSGTFGHPPASRVNAENYFERWANRYLNAELPSVHEGSRPKSPYDTMIYEIISFLESEEAADVDEIRRNHEMAMQSEIIVGELLEEYIDSVISPYGWIWCKGSCMQATDFYHPGDPELFLQVKNKFNTENSSSSKVRSGTDILKWNRLVNKRVPGSDAAKSNWEALWEIVFTKAGIEPANDVDLSEEGFKAFVEEACEKNPKLVIS